MKTCCQEESKLMYLRGREREIFDRCSSGCDCSGRLTVGRGVSVFLIILLSLVPVQVMIIVHVLVILIMHRHQQGVLADTPGWLLQHKTTTLPISHKFPLLGKTSPAEYLGHFLFTQKNRNCGWPLLPSYHVVFLCKQPRVNHFKMWDLRQAKISNPLWTCDLVTHIHASYAVNRSGSGTVISYAQSTSFAHSYKLCNPPV